MAGEATTARRFMRRYSAPATGPVPARCCSRRRHVPPSAPGPVRGLEAVQGFLGMFRAGMPDLSLTVEDLAGTSVCVARPRAVRIGGESGEEPGGEQRGDAVGEQEDERAHTRDGERRRQHVRPPHLVREPGEEEQPSAGRQPAEAARPKRRGYAAPTHSFVRPAASAASVNMLMLPAVEIVSR